MATRRTKSIKDITSQTDRLYWQAASQQGRDIGSRLDRMARISQIGDRYVSNIRNTATGTSDRRRMLNADIGGYDSAARQYTGRQYSMAAYMGLSNG